MTIFWYLKVAEIFLKFLYQVLTAVTVLQVPDIELVVENKKLNNNFNVQSFKKLQSFVM